MPAGTNYLVKIFRPTTPVDDIVGGAIPVDTLVHDHLLARIEARRPTMALLEQGLDTIKLFVADLSWIAKDTKENDLLYVFEPVDAPYAGLKFRIISVRLPSLRGNDPRSHVQVTLRRWSDNHTNQP